MNNRILIFLFVILTMAYLYAEQPPVGKSTVVGAVVIDLNGSLYIQYEPLRSNLPIRVAVEFQTPKGKTTMYSYKIQTDENGYYRIENAPAGKYILKAIEMNIGQSTHITAASKFGQWAKGKQYRYWGVLSGQMYRNERYLIETIFENEAKSDVIDMGITLLTINANERLGGTPFKNYSPNSEPPWIRLSMIQGNNRLADISVVDYDTRMELQDVKLQEKDVTLTMTAPSLYFELE